MMEKFDFLIGDWNLEYRVPKSAFSEAATVLEMEHSKEHWTKSTFILITLQI